MMVGRNDDRMRWIVEMFVKLSLVVLVMTLLKVSLQVAGLGMFIDRELDIATRTGSFHMDRVKERARSHALVKDDKFISIDMTPASGIPSEGLGAQMEIRVLYELDPPFAGMSGWQIQLKRRGVNTGYYGKGYLFE